MFFVEFWKTRTNDRDKPLECVSWNDAISLLQLSEQKGGVSPVYTINDDTVSTNFSAKRITVV